MDYKMLVDMAALAGTLMLENGAEIYRVEDTIRYILGVSGLETRQAFVVSTGLMLSLDDPSIDAITVIRRVDSKGIQLNVITMVNEISREFCLKKITLEEAYSKMKNLKVNQYSGLVKDAALIFVSAFFTGMLGGTILDMIAAGVLGILLAVWTWLSRGLRMHSIIHSFVGSLLMASGAVGIMHIPAILIHLNLVIIGAIMSLVPGAAITNAIRDTLHGDYSAGGAKILEAFVKAAMIALGVYCGLMLTGGSV